MHKCVKLVVSDFSKTHHRSATRADVERCLLRLEAECSGFTPEARRARENVNELTELLGREVANASDDVDIARWKSRLTLLGQNPWVKDKSGWDKVATA
jgi:hypothetical protein